MTTADKAANSICCLPDRSRSESRPRREAPPTGGTQSSADGRVAIPGGLALVGTDRPMLRADGEGPARQVRLKPFWLERCAVTVARFRSFVDATAYTTDAEQFGWSFVFRASTPGEPLTPGGVEPTWWHRVEGAMWRYPSGPGRGAAEDAHPVTHISWRDATAFAAWVGGRLPREAEWEHAARGGLRDVMFPWGDDEPDEQNQRCNIWKGVFPLAAEGVKRGPENADAFAPNGFNLHNMCGNVWEWTSDPFRVRSLRGASRRRSEDSRRENERVLKGGSFLCHKSYCFRYRIAARTGRSVDTSAAHTGFRVAYDSAASAG